MPKEREGDRVGGAVEGDGKKERNGEEKIQSPR